jgi:hypothetical protein
MTRSRPRPRRSRGTGTEAAFRGLAIDLAVAVPAVQGGLGVDRPAVDVDLEVEVAADRAGVAGLAYRADPLSGPDAIAVVNGRRTTEVGVEIAAVLALAVDEDVVAVEDRVVAAALHAAGRDGNQRCAAAGDDVEALVRPPAAAWRAEFADGATGPVRTPDREDVAEIRRAARIGPSEPDEEKGEKGSCPSGAEGTARADTNLFLPGQARAARPP